MALHKATGLQCKVYLALQTHIYNIMQTIEIFPTVIHKFIFNDHLKYKDEWMLFLHQSSAYTNTRKSARVDFTDPNLHKTARFRPFAEFLQDSLEQVMYDLGYVPSIQITACWATRHKDRQHHYRHMHQNSFLGGVYYLSGNQNSSGTTFHRSPTVNTAISPAVRHDGNLKMGNTWNADFEEGTLIIFPAWLEHSTGFNLMEHTNQHRHVLAFNSMPVGPTNTDEFDRYNYQDISNATLINNINL